jgi:hypothetical protein
VKVGDLVRYSNRYTTDTLVGVIYYIDYFEDPDCPYKVRWQCHTESMRDYYTQQELENVLESR